MLNPKILSNDEISVVTIRTLQDRVAQLQDTIRALEFKCNGLLSAIAENGNTIRALQAEVARLEKVEAAAEEVDKKITKRFTDPISLRLRAALTPPTAEAKP